MTVHYRALPRPQVKVGAVDLTQVLSVRAVFGLDVRVSECYITLPEMPVGINEWDPVTVTMGPDVPSMYARFQGYYVESRRTLAPVGVELKCYGPLIRARTKLCRTVGGEDLTNGGLGRTDEQMVGDALDSAGLTATELARVGMGRYISGTGETLGTVAYTTDPDTGYPTGPFTVREGESYLSFIERLEEVTLGYRTFELSSGFIVRLQCRPVPSSTAYATFTEHVDIESADLSEEILPIQNEIVVTGFDPDDGGGPVTATKVQESPFLREPDGTALYVTLQVSSDMIEKNLDAEAGDGLGCDGIALWRLEERNRKVRKLRVQTPRGDVLFPMQTVAVVSSTRLGVSENFIVQHVEMELNGTDGWTQTLTLLGGVGSTAPIARGPLADFVLTCEKETVVDTVEVARFTVHCRSTSVGRDSAIASYAWSETDGASGTEQTFTVVYETLTGKAITLTVTDANGQTDSRTVTVPVSTDPIWSHRRIYLAGKGNAEVCNPDGWAIDAPSAGDVIVATDAPVWGAGVKSMASDDYLATSADESTPFADGATPTCFHVETDLSGSRVLAGSSDGKLALSGDGGVTWGTPVDGPDGSNAILRCFISREDARWWYVLTAGGWFLTMDQGAGWATLLLAEEGETFKDASVSFTRHMIVMDGGRVMVDSMGNAQSLPAGVTGLIAVAPDIREDRFVAYDAAGNTYRHTASGGTVLEAREPLPDYVDVQERGLARDGAVRDLYYIAAGTSGAYKSIDGFATAAGYLQIRKPGVGNSPADADYTMIGADGLLVGMAFTPVDEYSSSSTKVLSLWDTDHNDSPPSGWREMGFDDSAWSAATEQGDSASITGAKDVWGSSVQSATEECLFRHTFAVGAGVPVSCVVTVDADDVAVEVWFNGQYVGTESAAPGTPAEFVISPGQVVPNADNVLAVWVRNADE